MDPDQAAELLVAANTGEAPEAASQPTPPPVSNQTADPVSPDQGTETGATEQDSFSNLDPNSLPAEVLPFYRSMQQDYTRKTQEISEQRKALEGLDPLEARGALDFVQSLNNDADFALSVFNELSTALEAAGLTPAQAQQVAAQQVDQAQQTPPADEWNNEYEAPVNPEILQRLEKTESFMEQYEQNQQRQQFEYALTQQENSIRESHPEWDGADMETVYSLAFANGGNLLAAADQYTAEQTRWATRFLAGKSSVPTGQPRAGTEAHVPAEGIKSLSDATAAALEMLRNEL